MFSSSLSRRLHGIFNHSRSPTSRFNKSNPSLPSSATQKCNKSTAATPLTAEEHLQNIVDKFIKNTESQRFRHQKGTYDSTVRLLAVRKKFSLIEDIIEAQKKYEDIKVEGFATRLIKLYGKAGMEVPQEVSIKADVISYNIVINAFCEMDALDKAILFFHDMEKNGMEPNLVTFNTLLTALYRKGQFFDGERVWATMENKNIAPDLVSYNARLRGMVLEKRIQDGIELLAKMEEKEIKPDVYSYNILIKGFCQDGDLEEAKKWYYKLKESEVDPIATTYRILLPLLCEQGDFDSGLQLCKEAIDKGFVFHTAEVQRVVDGLAEVSKTEEAKDLVELYNSKNNLKFKLKLPQNST
uniref:Pentacotripeptide-repeat region of PRORP domain-containing protein n=1 Tax=Cucumis sativus TaxID=3659 RepID=A0A0A0KLB2_CUCSA